MKFLRLIIFILLSIQLNTNAQTDYMISQSVKRIVFLGNSITYSGQYISYIETYLTLRYSQKQIEFINVGLPSETVSGLSEPNHAGGKFPRPDLHKRLERILKLTNPDLIFSCYGMNDGIYLPFDDYRFQKFREGINWMHLTVSNSGIPIIHLTPPVYDERKGAAYANVLDIYSDWLISRRYTKSWQVIDLHWPMKKYLEEKRLSDSTFAFAKDGVHPNEIGHWIMARQILLSLGEKDVANAENIHEAISSFKNGEKVLKLVEERQTITKDAWLTHIGYKRPGMNVGLPLNKANKKASEIENQIRNLLE